MYKGALVAVAMAWLGSCGEPFPRDNPGDKQNLTCASDPLFAKVGSFCAESNKCKLHVCLPPKAETTRWHVGCDGPEINECGGCAEIAEPERKGQPCGENMAYVCAGGRTECRAKSS